MTKAKISLHCILKRGKYGYIYPMIIHSSNFLIRKIPVSKQPFSGNNDCFSINPAVMQVKIKQKTKTLTIFLMERNLLCGKKFKRDIKEI